MFERFTDQARRVVVLAQVEARELNHDYIGTEHLLLGLIHEGEGIAARSLVELGVSLQAIRRMVVEIVGEGKEAPTGHIPFTPRAKKVLELSLREAIQLGHNYIGTEHVLLGVIREGEGVAAQVLVEQGVDLSRARQEVLRLLALGEEETIGGAQPPSAVRLGPARAEIAPTPVFDEDAQRALRVANAVAGWLAEGRRPVRQSDLLWGLIRTADPELAGLLRELGVDVEAAYRRLGEMMVAAPPGEPATGPPSGEAEPPGSESAEEREPGEEAGPDGGEPGEEAGPAAAT